MSDSGYVPNPLRRLVQERATGLCEYCRSRDDFTTEPFVVEHIFPRSLGGLTTQDNLAYSCSGCNGHKSVRTTGTDPHTETEAPLFHPRRDSWSVHFAWDETFTTIIGSTSMGRASVAVLNLNRRPLVNLRRALVLMGIHPPDEEDL